MSPIFVAPLNNKLIMHSLKFLLLSETSWTHDIKGDKHLAAGASHVT